MMPHFAIFIGRHLLKIKKAMDKFRKKPIVIEAIQLTEKNIFEVYTEVFGKPDLSHRIASDKWDEYEVIIKTKGMELKTPESGEGTQIASIGDYLVFGHSKELGRHCRPVKSDYFEDAYEKVGA